jgi:hypothetical protein
MLVDPESSDTPMHATFSLTYSSLGTPSWVLSLKVQPPTGIPFAYSVASLRASSLNDIFSDLHHVNLGFSGSTLASAATFDVLNVQIAGAPLTPLSTVPEPSSYLLALAGLAVAGWSLRRKT